MEIHCPDFWFRDPRVDYGAHPISMGAILPRVGERAAVGFSRDTSLRVGDVKTLLWQPPISELNGWSEQPSEIAQSCLVGARVIEVASKLEHQPHASHLYRHHLDILSCEPFCAALYGLQESEESRRLARIGRGRTSPAVSPIWDEVHWCGTAVVDRLIYLLGHRYESHLELIAEEVDGELFVLFNGYVCDGCADYDLGRHQLDKREQNMIRQAIHKAIRLADTFPAYLAA